MLNTNAWHQLLLCLDRHYPVALEEPDDFDYQHELGLVRKVKGDLERELGRPFALNDHVQDSPHFAELSAWTDRLADGSYRSLLTLYFSAFGKMVSVDNDVFPDEQRDIVSRAVNNALSKQGFVSIDGAWLLEHRYDGCCRSLDDPKEPAFETWFFRFFNYY